jgi:hypothetical protein
MIKRIEGDAYLVIKDGKIRDLYQGTNAWDNARRRADELDIPGNEDHILIVKVMYGKDGLVEPPVKPRKKLVVDDLIDRPSFSDRLRSIDQERQRQSGGLAEEVRTGGQVITYQPIPMGERLHESLDQLLRTSEIIRSTPLTDDLPDIDF